MTTRDLVIVNNISDYEVELIITDNAVFTLTQQFDEVVDMMTWSGLDFVNATAFYQCDEETKLELAHVEFDEDGKYEDGFHIEYEADTLQMLKIKWK